MDVYKNYKIKSKKTWHSQTSKVFLSICTRYGWFELSLICYSNSMLTSLLYAFSFVCRWRSMHQPMWIWSCIMKKCLKIGSIFKSNYKSEWKRSWNKCERMNILHFANTCWYVISCLVMTSWKRSNFITTWTHNLRCSQKSFRC